MLTRLQKAFPGQTHQGARIISICGFAFRSTPGLVRSALPFVFLSVILLVLGGVLVTRFGTLGIMMMIAAFWPALLAGFWIQWSAGAQVSTDCEFNNRWLILPPRPWLEKTAPIGFVLAAGFALLGPYGQAVMGTSTFAVVVWPLLLVTTLMFAQISVTGLSSVAAAQEIDADMSGYSSSGTMPLVINLAICLVSFLAVTAILGPVLFLVAVIFGIGEGWTTPVLVACLAVLIWSASSAAMAFLLEDKLWHTDFYN